MITETQLQSRATQVNNHIRAFNSALTGKVPPSKSFDYLRGHLQIESGDFDRLEDNLAAFYTSLPQAVQDDPEVAAAYSDLQRILTRFVDEVLEYEVHTEHPTFG